MKFSIILRYASTQELKVNVEEKISAVINKRFNAKTKVLNLDAFYKDPGLFVSFFLGISFYNIEFVDLEEFCPLSQPKILLFVLHICKSLTFNSLTLSNNEIRVLDALEPLTVLKVPISINLKNNLVSILILFSFFVDSYWRVTIYFSQDVFFLPPALNLFLLYSKYKLIPLIFHNVSKFFII